MKNSIVIGINWEQNSTAALMLNGKIIACVSEEKDFLELKMMKDILLMR